jgi:hypothetical protein
MKSVLKNYVKPKLGTKRLSDIQAYEVQKLYNEFEKARFIVSDCSLCSRCFFICYETSDQMANASAKSLRTLRTSET